MARSKDQKLKLLHLKRIFLDETDEVHGVTLRSLQNSLAGLGISCERKSLYDDIEALRRFGLDIVSQRQGPTTVYFVGERTFELAEIKLLVDVVSCSKFITQRKSMQLIRKLSSLAGRRQAAVLHRQVALPNRVKTSNETIYYSVDKIYGAIAENRKIKFQYFEYTLDKKQSLRRGGEYYTISPLALTWDDEKYYLIGYDSLDSVIKHFRVDKMLRISQTDERRDAQDKVAPSDIALYTQRLFSMFKGAEQTVTLKMKNNLIGAVIDRFGKDVFIFPCDSQNFFVNVKVAVSLQFFAWVFQFGGDAEITAPPSVVDEVSQLARSLYEIYCPG